MPEFDRIMGDLLPGGGNIDLELLAAHWREWAESAQRQTPDGWLNMVTSLGSLQDAVAATVPPADAVAEAARLIRAATALLEEHIVAAEDQLFGRHLADVTRGQTFSPPLKIESYSDGHVEATTVFRRFHSGNGGVVHGGAIALMFDDLLGRTADLAVPERSRTVSLSVDFRSLTPLDTVLRAEARMVERDGRKRRIQGALWDGDRLCAESSALFIELLPHQR